MKLISRLLGRGGAVPAAAPVAPVVPPVAPAAPADPHATVIPMPPPRNLRARPQGSVRAPHEIFAEIDARAAWDAQFNAEPEKRMPPQRAPVLPEIPPAPIYGAEPPPFHIMDMPAPVAPALPGHAPHPTTPAQLLATTSHAAPTSAYDVLATARQSAKSNYLRHLYEHTDAEASKMATEWVLWSKVFKSNLDAVRQEADRAGEVWKTHVTSPAFKALTKAQHAEISAHVAAIYNGTPLPGNGLPQLIAQLQVKVEQAYQELDYCAAHFENFYLPMQEGGELHRELATFVAAKMPAPAVAAAADALGAAVKDAHPAPHLVVDNTANAEKAAEHAAENAAKGGGKMKWIIGGAVAAAALGGYLLLGRKREDEPQSHVERVTARQQAAAAAPTGPGV